MERSNCPSVSVPPPAGSESRIGLYVPGRSRSGVMLIGCVSGMPSRCMRSSTASATGNLKTLIIGNRVSLRAIVSPPGVRTATPTKALCSDTISSSRDSNCRVAVSQDAARTDRHRSRSFFISWQRIKKHTFSGCAFFGFFRVAYPSMIASLGQTPAQVPQSMHLSGSMT